MCRRRRTCLNRLDRTVFRKGSEDKILGRGGTVPQQCCWRTGRQRRLIAYIKEFSNG
jgi:hypothetical protein